MFVGVVHALALLLLVAAAAKLRDPSSAMAALRRAGMPSSALIVRLLATCELAVASAALLLGGTVPAAALGLLHLAFAAFVFRLRQAAGPEAGCGCFGRAEAPADRLHVVVNVVASCLVGLAVLGSTPSLPSVLQERIGLAAPYLATVVLGAWVTGLCLTSLAALLTAQREATS